jgi:hypothetical protein
MRLIDAPFGSIIECYTNDGEIYIGRDGMGGKTVDATIIMEHHHNGVVDEHIIGWKDDVIGRAFGDYHYENHANGVMMHFGSRDNNLPQQYANSWEIVNDCHEYRHCKGIRSSGAHIKRVLDATYIGKLYEGSVISKSPGCFQYITADNIKSGDTIVYINHHYKMLYIHVADVSEGEDAADNPSLVLEGHVYSEAGLLSYAKGYSIKSDEKVLLISREEKP